jgi:acyl-CoA synthetase (NDP forming)
MSEQISQSMVAARQGDFADVSAILRPRSVAVIGASDRPGNFGGATVRRLLRFGFKGPVWPVNRAGAAVAGLEAFTEVSALPEVPDLAVLAVPSEALLEAIAACAAHGVKGGIAYAGGLGEAGGEGAALQDAIVALCRKTGFVLCGPNCVGVINAALPATPTFATALEEIEELNPGAISMVSQSGGIGTTAFSLGLAAGFGFRYLISSGNEAVVDFSDYLFALAQDPGTKVILGYLEGLKDGPKFLGALAEARRRRKAVVLIKAGSTGASARAALAHTGALVGEDRVFDAVLQEMAVVRVSSVEELVDVASLLVGTPEHLSFGPGIGIVTFGGGNGVLAADQCAAQGLQTPPLSEASIARLKPLLASVATAANPVDLTPTTAFRDEFLTNLPDALAAVADQADIDALLFIVGTLAARADEIIAVTRRFASRSPKPLCISWPSPPKGLRDKLAAENLYAFVEPADAARALGRLASRRGRAAAADERGELAPGFDWHALVQAPRTGRVIAEHECHAILRAAGLPVAEGALADAEDRAVAIATAAGFPVALKGIGADVTHRAAAGLVVLDARNSDDVRAGFHRLRARAEALSLELDGIYVQKMHGGRTELLVAAFNDPLFGPMVSCGSGGGLTELLDDLVTARAPLGVGAAEALIERLKIRVHARDGEGLLPARAPACFVAQLSELAALAPWRRFTLEVNPLKWSRAGAIAVDGLLIIDEA